MKFFAVDSFVMAGNVHGLIRASIATMDDLKMDDKAAKWSKSKGDVTTIDNFFCYMSNRFQIFYKRAALKSFTKIKFKH